MKQKVCAEEETETTKKKDILVGEVSIELGHISSVLIDIGNIHVHGSMQIKT